VAIIRGARSNYPREDLFRITENLRGTDADIIVSFGSNSTIDAAKTAEALRALSGDIDTYFGTGFVSEALHKCSKSLAPHVGI